MTNLERMLTGQTKPKPKAKAPKPISNAPATWYKGSWLMGKAHGFGVRSWPQGSFYIGGWRAGKRHGDPFKELVVKRLGEVPHPNFSGRVTREFEIGVPWKNRFLRIAK